MFVDIDPVSQPRVLILYPDISPEWGTWVTAVADYLAKSHIDVLTTEQCKDVSTTLLLVYYVGLP